MCSTTLPLLLSQKRHQLAGGGPAGTIRADGRRGGSVADEMDPRVLRNLRGQLAGHGYATAGFAQHQRPQMIEGATKTRAPEDHVGTNEGPVRPADAVFEDFAEHRQTVQHPSGSHGLDRWGDRQPRSSVKDPSRKSGGLRVTQVVVVTRETSSSSCIAEIPPPTTITCLPANSSAVR